MTTKNISFSLVTLAVCSVFAHYAPHASAAWLIDRSGTLIQLDGVVLGNEDKGKNQAEATRENLKQQTELKIQQNEKKVESLQTKSQYQLKNNEGVLELKGEIKDKNNRVIGTPKQKIEEGDSVYVEQPGKNGEMEQLRINAVKDGQMEMIKNRIRTTSAYELKVGEKNEISVTLPNGKTKEIALPDQALENLVDKGILTSLTATDGQADYELTASSKGEPVYQVDGQVEKKFLGILKLKFAQKMEVAASNSEDGTAQTGDVVSSVSRETNPWRKFIERLSN